MPLDLSSIIVPTREEYTNMVVALAESLAGKSYNLITYAELSAVAPGIKGPTAFRSVLSFLLKKKQDSEISIDLVADMVELYTLWDSKGRPSSWLKDASDQNGMYLFKGE